MARWLGDPIVGKYLTSAREPTDESREEALLRTVAARHGLDTYHFAVCLTSPNTEIGWSALFEIDRQCRSAALMLAIGERQLWGVGLGAEVLDLLIRFAFETLGLVHVWLDVQKGNLRARSLYLKLGLAEDVPNHHPGSPIDERTMIRLALDRNTN
jgi:RimJ/RimL family protein N-acetyltransferase